MEGCANKKIKMCQPPLGSGEDLIQTSPTASNRELTRPTKKNYKIQNPNHKNCKLDNISHMDGYTKMYISQMEGCTNKKIKMCQPPLGSGEDLIQTSPTASNRELTRPTKKNYKIQNPNINYSKLEIISQATGQANKKIKKCQPAVRDTPGTLQGPHPPMDVGVGVPDGGLTRPPQKNNKNLKSKDGKRPISSRTNTEC